MLRSMKGAWHTRQLKQATREAQEKENASRVIIEAHLRHCESKARALELTKAKLIDAITKGKRNVAAEKVWEKENTSNERERSSWRKKLDVLNHSHHKTASQLGEYHNLQVIQAQNKVTAVLHKSVLDPAELKNTAKEQERMAEKSKQSRDILKEIADVQAEEDEEEEEEEVDEEEEQKKGGKAAPSVFDDAEVTVLLGIGAEQPLQLSATQQKLREEEAKQQQLAEMIQQLHLSMASSSPLPLPPPTKRRAAKSKVSPPQ